ncbi:hybrid sensor histidine kinase/response regulator [Flavobacterium sp.]|uniref:hybrid sensor histidine kinase/response regulator n=1 Tax=Flavobacterium sp. TaxID=239 RepID=UPI003D126FC3
MNNKELHPHLNRLIQRHFSERDIWNDASMCKFLDTINDTYRNYERDIKLFERATTLNDEEFTKINNQLKEELVINNQYQKSLLEAKTEAEKANEAKSNFLSVMSHEIRTPLNAIIGSLYLIDKNKDANQLAEHLEILKVSSSNLLMLINDILDFNKIEANKLDLEHIPFSVNSLLNDIIKAQEYNFKSNNNSVHINIDPAIEYNLIGDPLRLNQILTNLISNASKFSKKKSITVTLREKHRDEHSATLYFEVKDTGIGIKKGNLKKIFQPFTQEEYNTTRKFGGTGLGLVIVSQLLRLYKSKINVASKKDEGSTFYFELTLPLSDTPSLQVEKIDEKKSFNGYKVLIVEDNLINVKILGKILSNWDITYEVAENGKIGYEKCILNNYDMIFMDLSMPVMDGFESTVLIRKTNKIIPIIAISASNFVNDISKAQALGFTDYITKPFNVQNLNSKLVLHLDNEPINHIQF